jgi:DNA-directed RNA polymerase subunit RPC12/RpoP
MGRKVEGKPQWMIVYDCLQCGMDSGLIELQPPKCFGCGSSDLVERERKELTPQVMADRMKRTADRMYENLQKAYDARPENFGEETQLLEALALAKDHKKTIYKMAEEMIRETQ